MAYLTDFYAEPGTETAGKAAVGSGQVGLEIKGYETIEYYNFTRIL